MFVLTLATRTAWAVEEAAPGFTMVDIWNHSGYLARAVIVMLFVMLLLSVVVFVERIWFFNTSRKQSMILAAQIVGPMKSGDIRGAVAMTRAEEFEKAYLATLLRAGLTEMDERFDKHGIHNAERALDKAASEEISKLRRGMTILATTGSTAPFVGLFGTTFGVINAFQGMATQGSGLAGISAGISEALITTGVGIGVAVVGVWFFNYFNQRTEKVAEELASAHADFMDWAEKLLLSRTEQRQAGK